MNPAWIVVQIRINANLFDSVKNAIESAIWGGNYEFESASHFLREALREHASLPDIPLPHIIERDTLFLDLT